MTKGQEYKEILKELGDIKLLFAERKHIDDEFIELKKDLQGNGKPGYKKIRDIVLDWESGRIYYTRVIVGLVLTNVISLAGASFIWFIKIYPFIESLSK